MSMFLPINVNLENKKIVVVGGGGVATRKINSLLAYNVAITVVAPEISQQLFEQKDRFHWIMSTYNKGMLEKADYVIAATNETSINKSVQLEANKLKILCLNSSDGTSSDFHMPYVLKKGSVQISIGTEGKSPAMAKLLGQEIEKLLTKETLKKIEALGEIRHRLKEQSIASDERSRLGLEWNDLQPKGD